MWKNIGNPRFPWKLKRVYAAGLGESYDALSLDLGENKSYLKILLVATQLSRLHYCRGLSRIRKGGESA